MLYSCSDKNQEEKHENKSIEVAYHKNIETVMILRALSDTDYFISRIPDSSTKWPMLYRARQYFKEYKNHPAVGETQRLLYSMQDIGGQLLQGVMYANEVPATGMRQEATDAYWREHKEELKDYMQLVDSFYIVAGADEFFRQNEGFYEGAIKEAQAYINDSVTVVMEAYFGVKNAAYKMYLMPMCPYGWAFSVTTGDANGVTHSGIISPVSSVEWDGTNDINDNFGFGGDEARAHYRELIIHEFVHPFITPIIERDSFQSQIAKYDYLYTPVLDSAMGEIGYTGWWSFVNEHLTRLGHIRVTEQMDKAEAEELRKTDINEYKYVLLPEAEQLMKEYENNRDDYKTIESFLPRLVEMFSRVDTATINKRVREEIVY